MRAPPGIIGTRPSRPAVLATGAIRVSSEGGSSRIWPIAGSDAVIAAAAGEEAVAVPVIAVAVGVEELFDRRAGRGGDGLHGPQHRGRQDLVPERVDQQRLAVSDHQSRVRLAEAAVRLDPGPRPGADLDQPAVEGDRIPERGALSLAGSHRTGG